MSSTTTPTTTTVMDRRTYWCHECDMSISLIPTTTTSLCPHCNSDFLEELDSPITFHNSSNPNPNNHHDSNQLLFPSSDFQFPSETPSDALDNPRIHHRVIRQFFISNHHFLDSDPSAVAPATTSRLHSPASKAAIESIPSVKITTASVEICAVCKDQFVIDDETKELPCKHMYHTDCIVPWLSMRNSCPVCRFQMPVDPVEGCDSKVRRRSRSRVLRLGDLVDDDNDDDVEELLGFGLRHLARRYRLVSPMRVPREPVGEVDEPEVLFSPTQIGEEAQVDVEHDSGRTNSVETVSSWPSWPVDGGEIDTRVNDDDHDVVMS